MTYLTLPYGMVPPVVLVQLTRRSLCDASTRHAAWRTQTHGLALC